MKKRILSILIIFSIVITAITSVICCSVYYRFYKDTVHDELKAKTIMLTESLNDIANNVKTLENIEKSGQIDFRITYILKDGRVAYDNTADIKAMENHSERIEFREAIKTGSGENLRRSESLNKDTYYYALRLQDGSVIRLSKEMDSVFSVFNTTIPIILAFLIILIICSIIISSILTKKILAPINKASEFIDNQNIVISDDFNCYDELLPFINQIRHLNFEDIKKELSLKKSAVRLMLSLKI